MKIFQNLIYQFKEIIDCEMGIIDENSLILASSNGKNVGELHPAAAEVLKSRQSRVVSDDTSFQKIYNKNKLDYLVYIKCTGEEAFNYLSLMAINISNIKFYFDEKFDKCNFIKNIILDNILPGDIPLKAKELHLPANAYRVVFLVRTVKSRETYTHDIIQGLFPNKQKDFVIMIDEENTVLIKEVKSLDEQKEIGKISKIIVDTLNSEIMVKAYVGIGTVADNLKDIAKSYKEAQLALLIGYIFDNDKYIMNYNNLGLGRLIYQLPNTLCKLFLNEVFSNGSFDTLDKETITTIQKFFENNLNVSETSRQLYVHRNTLVYRLDKIQKITGLDLRNFDDAIIFKVAMLVKRYLDKGEAMI